MEDLKLKYDHIFNLWQRFIHDIPFTDSGIISQDVYRSWQRSKQHGIDPYMHEIALVLDRDSLARRLRDNSAFIELCTSFMDNLYSLVKGSRFIVALFDSDGFLLRIIGDENILHDLTVGRFVPGSCWQEKFMGTNAVGVILHTGKPIQTFACEHYAKLAHRYTCSGAPIYNPHGNLIGIIDVTGFYQNSNPHTLGMVVAAATAISNLLGINEALARSHAADNLQKAVFSSIQEALLAIDNNGIVTLTNHSAEVTFRSSSAEMLGKHVSDLFGEKNAHLCSLVYNNRSLTDREVRLISHDDVATDYTLTCNSILSNQKQVTGKIIILTAIKRSRQLVTSMIGAKAKFCFEDIIGKNPSFLQNIELAKIASASNSNVLILGESGTGKDIIAQAIHNKSNRKDSPYLAINCAAIPRDLIASELFGYEEGSFTGSKKGGNPGKFELAEGGTIFLDEIGEIPLETQIALLRIIEEKSVLRIGAKKIRHVDVRIIAATNADLQERIEKKTFREDLFYRLNIFVIKLVPLRNRTEDIPLLVEYFVKNLTQNNSKPIKKIHPDFLAALRKHSWPGNVRELQNYIERAINISTSDELTVDLAHQESFDTIGTSAAKTNLEDIERNLIIQMMNANYSRQEIANKLGISRTTLYRKILQLNQMMFSNHKET
ncbi:MAG TPA: PAS domain-containing protein [Candidatus Bathyarchaeota archaeon]|nr:PAS domain-containing protein [Candidatus Bathyarchaeota archaeon]